MIPWRIMLAYLLEILGIVLGMLTMRWILNPLCVLTLLLANLSVLIGISLAQDDGAIRGRDTRGKG